MKNFDQKFQNAGFTQEFLRVNKTGFQPFQNLWNRKQDFKGLAQSEKYANKLQF